MPAEFSDLTLQLQTYTPPEDVTTMFRCTPTLSGRLYPSPCAPGFYILDFLDNNGTRVRDTGLNVYDRDVEGRGKRGVYHYRSGGAYHLLTARVAEITDGNDERLKVISFSYLDRSVGVPWIVPWVIVND